MIYNIEFEKSFFEILPKIEQLFYKKPIFQFPAVKTVEYSECEGGNVR